MDTKDKDVRTYALRLQGHIDADFVASFCPDGTTMTHEGDNTLLANIQTDQSGILGLVRHLHNLGCTILTLRA